VGERHSPTATDDHPCSHPGLKIAGSTSALRRSAGYFAGLDARGADVEPLGAAGHSRVYPLDVRVPAAVGLLLRPGHVVAESGPLAAYVTYRSHWSRSQNRSIQMRCPMWATGKEYPTDPSTGQLLGMLPLLWVRVSQARRAGAHALGGLRRLAAPSDKCHR
jgi:hypothetical protein